jgi:hypothetical protein
MAEIRLLGGEIAYVDDEDLELVNRTSVDGNYYDKP